ncbi:hypothetical protein [Nitrosopumilus sp.]|uniref:hypothetical protein n=1 Tax=Nitrosopumilus sp. TaxID=2024843 RepID=UPI0026153A53|nr:hypothetical protein [Nitrosopumilus sp.]
MSFEIFYKFKKEEKTYSCTVTHEQYKNLRKLPTIEQCQVVRENEENIEKYMNEMQKALDLAVKNDTSHIRQLSQIIDSN